MCGTYTCRRFRHSRPATGCSTKLLTTIQDRTPIEWAAEHRGAKSSYRKLADSPYAHCCYFDIHTAKVYATPRALLNDLCSLGLLLEALTRTVPETKLLLLFSEKTLRCLPSRDTVCPNDHAISGAHFFTRTAGRIGWPVWNFLGKGAVVYWTPCSRSLPQALDAALVTEWLYKDGS